MVYVRGILLKLKPFHCIRSFCKHDDLFYPIYFIRLMLELFLPRHKTQALLKTDEFRSNTEVQEKLQTRNILVSNQQKISETFTH